MTLKIAKFEDVPKGGEFYLEDHNNEISVYKKINVLTSLHVKAGYHRAFSKKKRVVINEGNWTTEEKPEIDYVTLVEEHKDTWKESYIKKLVCSCGCEEFYILRQHETIWYLYAKCKACGNFQMIEME